MLDLLRSRQWVAGWRLFLVGIVLIVAYRQYGDAILLRLRGPRPAQDIEITRTEFRPELTGAKPAWIIGFRNNSPRFTYDNIELEAAYIDSSGKVLETDKLVVKQKLPPGDEKLIGSVDFKSRGPATHGTLKVVGAQQVR